MRLFLKITSNIVFAIHVMIVFLLLFENRITLPLWLQSVGRMHPFLLHLPIGLLIGAFILWVTRGYFVSEKFPSLLNFILHLTALTASLTALMGFFLSREEGYSPALLSQHKWTGVGVSFLCYLLMIIYNLPKAKKLVFNVTMTASIIALILAGHFGASLTHGEGFVWEPMRPEIKEEPLIITDSTPLFLAAVQPVLKAKCFSCHNDRKAKGQLVMTTPEKLLKGGKNGPIWVSGDPLNSHIIKNIQLPEDDKKHMPPEGKPQLSAEEIQLLYSWIQSGADMKKAWKQYPETDSTRKYAAAFIEEQIKKREEIIPAYTFKAASTSAMEKLNDPFRVVSPLALGSPAVQVSFYVRENFDRKKLEQLAEIKDQLVSLNLSNMPVTDNDLPLIARFSNLEKLILNNTDITGKNFSVLTDLRKLTLLSLSGTRVNKNIAPAFSHFPALKEVFIWNTGLNQIDAVALEKEFKKIHFNVGYQPDPNEILKLTPPVFVNDNTVLENNEGVILKHSLPGTIIRFTTDSSIPDSITTQVYKDPVNFDGFTVIKARATRDKWYSSDVAEFYIFKKGYHPVKAELINETNAEYKGEGGVTLIDSKKGVADNFKDIAWLGFREKPFAAFFYFDEPPVVKNISISYGKNVGSFILPPVEIELWGGNDNNDLKLIRKVKPPPVLKDELRVTRVEGLKIDIPASQFKCYKLVAKNIQRLPEWHPGKGQKGWVFIDEVFFN
jgi:cytochrome c/Fn3 domain-containing protein